MTEWFLQKNTHQTDNNKWAIGYKKFWLFKLLPFDNIWDKYCWKQTISHERWQSMFHICKRQLFAISTFARVGKISQAQEAVRSAGWHSSCLSSLTGYWYVDMSISLTRKTKLDPSNVRLSVDSRADIPTDITRLILAIIGLSFLPLQLRN